VAWNRRSLVVVLAGYIVLWHFSCFDFMNIRIVGIFHAAHRLGFESLPVGYQFFYAFTIRLLSLCEWGMSDLGPLSFGKKEEQISLGREIAQHRDYSEATAVKIDEEVQKLVIRGYDTAKVLLSANRDVLVRIALALLDV
jgi:hypothetical protein